ncbi:hypothetical protein [Sphingomonas sp. LT1P40]|uniref:hypothetical protein n=1 Tax=Alteristakelama amylovorans TaxID=3096166 RepID=UPI002FCB4110
MKLFCLTALLLLPVPALAADFSCRNEAAELTCDQGKCDVKTANDFTPMSISRRGTTLTACAYSGCWSGTADLRRARGHLEFLHARVRQENRTDGKPGPPESLAIIHDRTGRTAQIRFLAFSNSMTCD